ncbi:putative F-box domain-containing protein [Helianthus annuus]|nr:putative F-box domain-containing protein [Helianthus annuus]
MSDHIPFEIQLEIMNGLPVKSLLRFRSVSKRWKSLIDSSGFIAQYSSQRQHLLLRYEDVRSNGGHYASFVVDDGDSFPTQSVSVTLPELVKKLKRNSYTITDGDSFRRQSVSVTLPDLVKRINYEYSYTTIVSSHGLFCFFCDCPEPWETATRAVIWNPSIRKAVDVVVPRLTSCNAYRTALGFGVCGKTMDPKIVKITRYSSPIDRDSWQVEVFTLSTRAWRSPYSTSNLPRKSISFVKKPIVVDGCLYWLACDRFYHLIVSFDLTSEEFRQVNLPDSLAHTKFSLFMYNLRESIVVLEHRVEANKQVYHVWMMEDGVTKSFNKLSTISNHSSEVSIVGVMGFRKTGELLIEYKLTHHHYHYDTRILIGYDPSSKSTSDVGINGRNFSVYSYMETLLLL